MRPVFRCVPILVVLALLAACGGGRKTQPLDFAAVERGDIHLDWVEVAPGAFMVRLVAMIEASPERVMNVFADVEGMPLWDPTFDKARVLRREADFIDFELDVHTPPGVTLSPMQMRSRLDRQRMEVALSAYENEWLRSLTWVNKLEPMGGPDRTLLTIYARSEIKSAWGRLAAQSQDDRLRESVKNLRRAVKMSRYDAPPVVTQAAEAPKLKVLVQPFAAGNVPPEIADTLARLCAEQLMRRTSWSVMTHREIGALLTYSQHKELTGCSGEGPCALDVGRTLEAERLVVGNVTKLGNTYVLDMSLVALPAGTIERRASAQAASDDELPAKLQDVVQALVATDARVQ